MAFIEASMCVEGGDMMKSNAEVKRYNYLVSEIEAVYHEAAKRFGMSDSVMMVLYVLSSSEGACLLSALPYLTGISKQTLHSALRKLEGDGMVQTTTLGARKKVLSLTKDGEALCAQTVARLIEAENEIFDAWTTEERQQYLALTQRYLENIGERVSRF